MSDEAQIEARERRRAKILASKDARMARITGVHKNDSSSSQESLKVDEVVLQELIAESKKHAVELAKEDYALTHKENDSGPDELLSPQEIKKRQEEQIKSQVESIRQDNPSSHLDSFLSSLVVLVSAISAAFFLLKRSDNSFNFCFSPLGIAVSKIEECRQGLLPAFLQTVPAALVMALLPLLSDWFKGRKPLVCLIGTAVSRSILFLVIFLVSLRILTNN